VAISAGDLLEDGFRNACLGGLSMNARQDFKSRKDSFDDVSEADAKKTQQYQERKIYQSQEMASKLMKQNSDTSLAITGNLK
jgi:hypothetical protein